jgi:hypothetical protein
MLKKWIMLKYKFPDFDPNELSDHMTNWEMGLFVSDNGSWTVIWGIRDSERCTSCGLVRRATGK